jgi:flagellar FliL protein
MANANAVPANPETSAAAPEAPPRSSKKLLLLGIAAVILVGGGAAYFLRGDDVAGAGPEQAEPKAPAQYVALDPPFVVNFDAGANARFLQVTVQLMTRDLAMAEFIKSHDPVIRNDLLLLLGNQKAADIATREGKEQLRLASLEVVREIVRSEGGAPEEIEAVYFTSFVMQ